LRKALWRRPRAPQDMREPGKEIGAILTMGGEAVQW
jgi:hypothetical protein